MIEESYHWWSGNVEYTLARLNTLPSREGAAFNEIPRPESITPLDPTWILFVRMQVETNPERMQQAYAKLLRIQETLLGVFEFKVFDRRTWDTRDTERNLKGTA